MKKINNLLLAAFLGLSALFGLTGCNLDNDQKTELVAASVRITAMTGTKIAIQEDPNTAPHFEALAGQIDSSIEAGDLDSLPLVISNFVGDISKSDYGSLVGMGITEAVTLYEVFIGNNPDPQFEQAKVKVAAALSIGIRRGLALKALPDELEESVPEQAIFKLK